jgi:hypothetical protein
MDILMQVNRVGDSLDPEEIVCAAVKERCDKSQLYRKKTQATEKRNPAIVGY